MQKAAMRARDFTLVQSALPGIVQGASRSSLRMKIVRSGHVRYDKSLLNEVANQYLKKFRPTLPDQFINAWQHIYAQLEGSQPLPPATFDWNPNVQGLNNNEFIDPGPFYPGSGFVDWIAADGYDKEATTKPNNPVGFPSVVQAWYTEFEGYGKPLMVGETGACDSYQYPYDQASYIRSFQSTMEPGAQQMYPGIKALLYFDAPGLYAPPVGGRCHYSLSSQPQPPQISGFQAFVNLAADAYFSAYVVQQ